MAPQNITVKNPALLPGAIFILTVTPKKPSASAPATPSPVTPGQTSSEKPKVDPYTVVAYDPEITNKDKFSTDVIQRYEQDGLPYFEDFADFVPKFGPDDYYSK